MAESESVANDEDRPAQAAMSDADLDAIEQVLDGVDAALAAIDADDLDMAERVVASLEDDASVLSDDASQPSVSLPRD